MTHEALETALRRIKLSWHNPDKTLAFHAYREWLDLSFKACGRTGLLTSEDCPFCDHGILGPQEMRFVCARFQHGPWSKDPRRIYVSFI